MMIRSLKKLYWPRLSLVGVTILSLSLITGAARAENIVDKLKAAAAQKVEEAERKAAEEKARKEAAEIDRKRAEEAGKRAKLQQEARGRINNFVWKIQLTQMTSDPKRDIFTDTIKFVNNQVQSEALISDGFGPTNYSVSVPDENTVVWETMQGSPAKGIAFWKGEITGNVMRGVMSRHPGENVTKDYSFMSTAKEPYVEKPKAEASAAAAGEAVVEGETKAEAPKEAQKAPEMKKPPEAKKKKGIF